VGVSLLSPVCSCAQENAIESSEASSVIAEATQLSESGQIDSAVKLLTESIEQTPTAKLFIVRGEVHLENSDSKSAVADFAKAIDLEPNNADAYRLRAYETAWDDPESSVADLRKVLSLEPQSAKAANDLGAVLTIAGEVSESERFFRKAIELDADYPHTYPNLVENLRLQGRLKEAVAVSDQALEREVVASKNYENRAQVLSELGRSSEAVTHYTSAIAEYPNRSSLRHRRGNEYMDLGKLQNALSDFQYCLDREPDNVAYLTDAGRAHQSLGQSAKAMERLNRALKSDPDHDWAYYYRGQVHFASGDYDKAIADYQSAVKLDAEWADAWCALADCHATVKQYEQARDAMGKAIELEPRFSPYRVSRARWSLLTEHLQEARVDALAAIEIDPDDSDAMLIAGDAHQNLKEYAEAVKCFSAAIDGGTEDDNELVWLHRGQCYEALGKAELAAADFARAKQIRPPLDDADRATLETIASLDAEEFVSLLAPSIRSFVDQEEVARRLQMMKTRFPKIDSLLTTEIKLHPNHGRMQTEITLLNKRGDKSNIGQFTIGRNNKGELLGVEARGVGWSVGTMDAVKEMKQETQIAKALVENMFAGDAKAAVAALPVAKDYPQAHAAEGINRLTEIVKVLGRPKHVEILDTVLEMPGRAGGEVRVSVYVIATTQADQYATGRIMFQPFNGRLMMSNMDIGDSVQAKYLSQDASMAQRYADAFGSGDADKFIDLTVLESAADFGSNDLTVVFQQQFCDMAGKYLGMKPGSLSQEITITDGDFQRSVSFIAQFEEADLFLQGRFGTEYLTWVNSKAEDTDIDWMSGELVKNRIESIAVGNIENYLTGTTAQTLQMIKGYSGFGGVTKEAIEGLKSKLKREFGDVSNPQISDAVFDPESAIWQFNFSFDGSVRNGTGQISYANSNLTAALQNVSTN
jgi:tetratricopeptide (TPR) repeat protein